MATTNTLMLVEFVMQLANHGSPRGRSTVVCTREEQGGFRRSIKHVLVLLRYVQLTRLAFAAVEATTSLQTSNGLQTGLKLSAENAVL
jgi:hypothetical protein